MNLGKITERAIALRAIQKPSELQKLLEVLSKSKPKTIVEIGTAKGGTLYALCQVADDDALIVSIDLPGGSFGGGYSEEEQKEFLKFKKENQRMFFIREDSHNQNTRLALMEILDGRSLDFLLIDGDHTYSGVKKDWELYSKLVAEGGLIAFHDICFHPTVPECEVEKFWNEIKDGFDHDIFIDQSDVTWGGIGLLKYGPKESHIRQASPYGLLLHLGTNVNPPKGFLVMDQNGNADINHDFESFPWPLEDNSVHICIGPHVIEHIKPWLIIPFFNELWRIMKPDAQVALSTPYAGSAAYFSDPTHCSAFNERSFAYFVPEYAEAYSRHKPKPWTIERNYPTWRVDGNLEIIMRPRK